MNITNVLAEIGQQAHLKNATTTEREMLFTEMYIPTAVQTALITNDRESLEKLAGFKQNIICFIGSPAKERDTPKDDNKPPQEDEPFKEQPQIAKTG